MESSGKTQRQDSEDVAIDLSQSSNDVHELLRGGRPNYQNNIFSKSQMEALTSLCDTLVPSLDFDGMSSSNNAQDNDELRSFYGVSASSAGIPDHLAGYISERLMHAAVGLMKLSLWLLSTCTGGRKSCFRGHTAPGISIVFCSRVSNSCAAFHSTQRCGSRNPVSASSALNI